MSTNKDFNRLNLLFEMAKEVEPTGKAKMAAALYIKNELVGVGWNQQRSNPLAVKYQKHAEAITLHAEIHAIKQALRLYSVDELARAKTTLYICRAKRKSPAGEYLWGLSKPCVGCLRGILDFGIKRIVYSMDETVEHGRFYEELP